MTSAYDPRQAQGGGYPPGGPGGPPGGYGPPGGPGGYGPPGGPGGPGGYGPPGGPGGPGGYGPPGGPGGYGPPGGPGGYGPPGGPGGYGPPGGPGGYGPPGYGPPGGPYGAPGPAWGAPTPELKKRAQTWLIVSVASVVFCTSCFGIIGGILCFMAMQAVDQGNLADAENKLKWGKIITLVGLGLGILLSIGFVVLYAADIMAKLASP